jgi:GT2 family glycosyltransferase
MSDCTEGVTAVLVNYFGHADIAQAVASLLADAPTLDIIVVDNSDDSREAAALQAALPAHVTLAHAPHNLGFGQACNWAASMRPDATFYWLVNPDVRVLRGCLAGLRQAMTEHPELGAVAPLQFLDADQTWLLSPSWRPTALGTWASELAQRQPHAWQRYTNAVLAENRRVLLAKKHAEQGASCVLTQRALSGAIMFVRRAAVAAIGGLFDPRYFMYYEDSDLCLRLRRGGWGMGLASNARALHLWTMGAHKAQLMAQAAPVYFNAHFPNSPWLVKAHTLTTQVPPMQISRPTWQQQTPLHIPEDKQTGWMLELSPLPLLLPSAICEGQGATAPWPSGIVQAVQGADLWARLSPLASADAPSPPTTNSLWWRLA